MRFLQRVAPYRAQLVTVGIMVFVALAVAAAWPFDLFHSNQNPYFPHGLYLSGHPYLQNDWYVHTRPTFAAFAVLVGVLDRLGVLAPGAAALEIGLYLCLLFALWLVIGKLYDVLVAKGVLNPTGIRRREFALIILIIYVILPNVPVLLATSFGLSGQPGVDQALRAWSQAWDMRGLANQYAFGRYLQPSEFAILALLALALMLYRRWRIAVLLLAICTNIHFGFILHGSVLVMTAAAWLYHQGDRRNAAEITLIFGAANLQAFVAGPMAFALEPGSAEVQYVMVNIRIPFHSAPWVWLNTYQVLKVGVMLFASILLIWKVPGVLRWIVPVGAAFICAGIIAVLITRSDSLALMQPWRSSVYLYPISQVVLLVFAAAYGVKFLYRFQQHLWGVVLAASFVVLVLAALAQIYALVIASTAVPLPDRIQAIADVAQQHTTISDVIMIPADPTEFQNFQDFKLKAQRPVFVEAKSPPYYPADFLEWWRRMGVVEDFYAASQDVRVEICHREGVNYYVLPASETVPAEDVVGATADFQIVRCAGI